MSLQARKVLIVDDDASLAPLLELQMLSLHIGQILEARDGLRGLSLARAVKPDLIITDLAMPVMTGLEMIQRVRQDPHEALRGIPIIVVSGDPTTLQVDALRAGANLLIQKPVRRREILDAVIALLR